MTKCKKTSKCFFVSVVDRRQIGFAIVCTPNDRRSGFFSKTFHWWFVCCVPPLIGPKRVVKSGGPARSKRVRTFGNRISWVRRGLPRSSPTTPSASSKVRRPQFAAAGREAACGVHYAARSADWHTHAWGVIGGTRYDSWRVDCMRGCCAMSYCPYPCRCYR